MIIVERERGIFLFSKKAMAGSNKMAIMKAKKPRPIFPLSGK
jgi:hypothetical protein